MSSNKATTSLPPLPASLKAVAPFVQRANELRSADPIIAYWCTYYAAQLGLDIKAHESGASKYLSALITLLEQMKRELGANDAVDNQAAAAAYVENFALKVFSAADSEDRNGNATRATARKFLAASHFLELLRVFENVDNAAQANAEKIRYAKWKASDIAKAFREGRKPMPGSVKDDPAQEQLLGGELVEGSDTGISNSSRELVTGADVLHHAPSLTDSIDPGTMNDEARAAPRLSPHDISGPDDYGGTFVQPSAGKFPAVDASGPVPAMVASHNTPFVMTLDPQFPTLVDATGDYGFSERGIISASIADISSEDSNYGPSSVGKPLSPFAPDSPSAASHITASAPPRIAAAASNKQFFRSPKDVARADVPHSPNQLPEPAPITELSHSIAKKVQKHCRFAISALEYEDPEQARKELLTALALLEQR